MIKNFKTIVFYILIISPFYSVLGCSEAKTTSKDIAKNIIFNDSIREHYDIPYYLGSDADSTKHKLNLFIPDHVKNPPIMLWIHGGAWAFGGRKSETELARNFTKQGIAVAVMSYRLSPATWQNPERNTGVQHPAHIQDVAKAFAWVYDNASAYQYDKYSIFVSGYSAGAHLSALLAMDPSYLTEVGRSVRDIKAAIPIAGAYDMVAYYNSHLASNGKTMADSHVKGVFGDSMKVIQKASPTEYMSNQWVPMLVVSEIDTYDYTKLFEIEAKTANYNTITFHHVRDKNHAGLYQDLSKNGTSEHMLLISDYIKTHKANYSFLNRGNFNLAYKTFGEGSPMFLLNGGPGFSSHNFQSLAKTIAAETKHQIIIFDQRGTGYSEIESPNSNNMTLDLMVEDLEHLRTHLKYDKVGIMGQSFGGIYAMSYAAKYPKNVKQLILSHSGGLTLDFASDVNSRLNNGISTENQEQLRTLFRIDNPELRLMAQFKLMSSGYVFNTNNEDIVYKGLAFNSRFYPIINQLIWQDMTNHYDVSRAMTSFDKPVLILHGDKDIVNPKSAQVMHTTFPNSKLVLLNNCRHYGWLDQPDIYFSELFNFLKG
nr:alpha/beta hydrolase [uncultured Psychroserpens sp.]